jgi:hypothetical protein
MEAFYWITSLLSTADLAILVTTVLQELIILFLVQTALCVRHHLARKHRIVDLALLVTLAKLEIQCLFLARKEDTVQEAVRLFFVQLAHIILDLVNFLWTSAMIVLLAISVIPLESLPTEIGSAQKDISAQSVLPSHLRAPVEHTETMLALVLKQTAECVQEVDIALGPPRSILDVLLAITAHPVHSIIQYVREVHIVLPILQFL